MDSLDSSSVRLYNEGPVYQYWICIYYSVIMLVGGDIYPNTSVHDSVAGLFILSGAIVTAIMFGNMAVIITSLNKKVVEFQEKQDIVNTTIKNLKLDERIQNKILDYIMYTHSTAESTREIEHFLSMISPSLRKKVYQALYIELLRKNILFCQFQEEEDAIFQ